MSLNNPQDSVCDYLAELLYDADELASDPPAQTASARGLAGGARPTEPESGNAAPVAPAQAQPIVQGGKAQEAVETTDLDRDKLNRLLSSAQFARSALVTEVKATPDVHVEPPEATPQQDSEVIDAVPVVEPHADASLQWCENGRPQWAQERFDVLLFKVYGLTLAVPLIALGQIQPIDDQLTPLFGQADWFMGIQPTPMGKIKTVNTALFVMPERYNEEFLTTAKYVISIHGVPWGLAVDSVEQPKTLSPDDVKWRSGRTQRPWLAGTVKEYMCALIDIPNMAELLNASDRNSRKARP